MIQAFTERDQPRELNTVEIGHDQRLMPYQGSWYAHTT